MKSSVFDANCRYDTEPGRRLAVLDAIEVLKTDLCFLGLTRSGCAICKRFQERVRFWPPGPLEDPYSANIAKSLHVFD
jgi:hypothetical protein